MQEGGSVDAEERGEQCGRTPLNQLAVYNPGSLSSTEDLIPDSSHVVDKLALVNSTASNPSNRVLSSIGTFTIQCASCFKWRVIPTKEKYEQIRESISQMPFYCESAREWRPDISCDDPADIVQDGSRLWAIDKPNIAQPPPGWVRELKIRGEGSTKFADVYYVAPSGKKLRSMVDIQRYLEVHPEYDQVNLSQFSFQIPRPLQENYVKKRPSRSVNAVDGADVGLPQLTQSEEALPLSWACPPAKHELEHVVLEQPSSNISNESLHGFSQPTKKRPAKEQVQRPKEQVRRPKEQVRRPSSKKMLSITNTSVSATKISVCSFPAKSKFENAQQESYGLPGEPST
ncbi:Methyl-CpG-binding domain-containing protein 2 [Apostasia shenzhenica]|uniref:Methyl-CpG-binding domain-containing protein 2 n=1 Tax=Apostasia shenzhenica TaxID=1088818 RepID=A0A2I0BDE8_9ASPA|nr:Methyl-CpG-binding domain-containing protein 2 [Apostasia shenzhenica]